MTSQEIDTILGHITTVLPNTKLEPDVDNDLLYIEFENGNFIVLYPPKGYLKNEKIANGWICLQNIFRGNDDLLEHHSIIRGITIKNYLDIVQEIMTLINL